MLCTEEKKKISTLEQECERLRTELQQQIEGNKKAQEEIQYLKEQVILEQFKTFYQNS